MTGQVLQAAGEWGKTPTHVVWMGVGEPFDNYEQCLKAVRIVNDKDGLNIGARRLTISTCGIIPGITRLAGEGLQVELSVSLHAVDDKLSVLDCARRKSWGVTRTSSAEANANALPLHAPCFCIRGS
jgi:23S rRNA (adenine2503-C2)-methyltransferase